MILISNILCHCLLVKSDFSKSITFDVGYGEILGFSYCLGYKFN